MVCHPWVLHPNNASGGGPFSCSGFLCVELNRTNEGQIHIQGERQISHMEYARSSSLPLTTRSFPFVREFIIVIDCVARPHTVP